MIIKLFFSVWFNGDAVEFLRFHVYNLVHPITTSMNPSQNRSCKRKYLLNRSQEY